jgi:hypothetical protein
MQLRRRTLVLCAIVTVALAALSPAYAAPVKTYQVTGPVLEVTDTMIVVQKGQDRWEIARDASTKVTGALKVGARVTIEYRMTATAVQVKGESGAKRK